MDFLMASFALLQHERLDIYHEFCRRLAPRLVAVNVGDESATLTFSRRRVDRVPALRQPDIEALTDVGTVLDVIDARATLMEAILNDRLFLRGSTEDLLAFHDGLMAYVHGAVRAPSFPWLLAEFRAAARHRRSRAESQRAEPCGRKA